MRQTIDDRGTGRTEAFSDGVIAVAITLLVLDIHVPNVNTDLLQALLKQWPAYLGYVTSFLVITIFWANHHNMFRHIQQVDYALLIINAFFLMCIAFIPFATAVLTKYITSPTNQHTAAIVYGATLLLNGILFNTIWWYAVWKRRLVRSDLDAPAVQRITRGYLFGLPFYALAIVLSLINVELSLAFYTPMLKMQCQRWRENPMESNMQRDMQWDVTRCTVTSHCISRYTLLSFWKT